MEEEEREPSVASSSDLYSESDTPAATHHHGPPAKRKAEDVVDRGPDKKRKLDPVSSSPSPSHLPPCIGLPPEIWQNVFLSCSPATLGRLLQVNRSFRSYLLDAQPRSADAGRLNLLRSDQIWTAARKAHPTKPPKPPEGLSEVDLWRLLMGKKCQFCQTAPTSTPGEKPWEKGPGLNGVRIIWPFWVRSCGNCLSERCEKDTSLLFSTASALRPALPFAFITSDLNVIAASSLQDPALPPNLQISKVYYKPQIQEMEVELAEAQSRGPAAAEEWLKGLDNRGRARMSSSGGWERWETKYQPGLNPQDNRRTPMSTSASPSPNYPQKTGSPIRPPTHFATTNGSAGTATATQPLPPRPAVSAQQQMHAPQHTSQPPLHHPRPERNIHDANEAKAARKADIERRCEALSPPIPANVLRHMESFKAAIQISQPMTEYSWEVLKPRLLAQRPEAERAESEQAARMASIQTRIADRRQQDASLKEVKEVLDREWEDSQKPIRDLLSSYADDFVRTKWSGEKSINCDSSPKFAAELLLHVRERYYSDVSKEDNTANAPGVDLDQPDQSPRRTLILENMKWVYDNKIKPLTEQYRKELFLCNGGGLCEGNFRYYGFEGVIQHYGAKHTSAFSVGNIVVSWKEAEWPEEPPFVPDPSAARNPGHSVPTSLPAHGHSAYAPYYGGYSRGGTTTPQMPLHLSSPSPYLPYGTQFNGPFPPPPPPPNPVHGPNYNYTQGYAQPQSMDPYNGAYQPGYLYSTSPLMAGAIHPQVPPGNGFGFHTSPRQEPATTASTKQELDVAKSEFRTNLFDEQVRYLVDVAREIWTSTSGIKDLPNSVRVYVLLHRVISKFQLEFVHEPTLDHFADAVSDHHSLRHLKSATGLSCKACHIESISQSPMSHVSRAEDRKTYNVLSLFSHFKSIHLDKFGPRPTLRDGQPLRLLDWKEDMIELPSDRTISGLIHAPGMDDDKLLIIATVFPTLFPTPLPRIGVVDQSGVASASLAGSKNTNENREPADTLVDDLGPSPRKSPCERTNPLSSRLGEEEYDPLRPALVREPRHAVGPSHRRPSHSWSPPPDDRRLYYAEPRMIVGGSEHYPADAFDTDARGLKRPRDPMDDEYVGPPRGYMEVIPNGTRYIRDTGPLYEEIRDRRPVYRDREGFPGSSPHGAYYSDYPDVDPHDRGSLIREGRPLERDLYRGERQLAKGARLRSRSQSPRPETDAERFLNEFVPPPPLQQNIRKEEDPHQPWTADVDHDDASRYTPPPALVAPREDLLAPHPRRQDLHPLSSNGSRYEDARPNGGQLRTPDSTGNPPRRTGAGYRRGDRNHRQEFVPSRYARYMSAAREEPYARGHSITRSHSRYERRYERYDEQRRRLDQQEGGTPQPGELRERERDRSVDIPPYAADERERDPYYSQLRHASREYVPVDDHRPPPTRYTSRFAAEPAEPSPQFVEEFNEPVYVRVREAYQPRYVDDRADGRERIEYVYDRAPREREYVYYDERAPGPGVPLSGQQRIPPRIPPGTVDAEMEPGPFEGEVEGGPLPAAAGGDRRLER